MPFSAKTILICRRLLISLATFGTLLVAAVLVENWRGDRAWKAVVKKHADLGDPLNFLPPEPSPIPSGKNFLQTPLLARLLFAKSNSPEIKVFKESNETFGFFPANKQSWEKGQHLDLDDQVKSLRKFRTEHKLEETPVLANNAASILSLLKSSEPVLLELREAALTRPLSQVVRPTPATLENLFKIETPGFPVPRFLVQSLSLQAVAALGERNADLASGNVLAGLRLANGIGNHPYTLVEVMISAVLVRNAIQPLWEGMQHHAWSDAQLVAFGNELSQSRLLAGLILSIQNERNAAMYFSRDSLDAKENPRFRWYQYMPEGWWQQNQITGVEITDLYLDAIRNHSTPEFLPNLKAAGTHHERMSSPSPYRLLANDIIVAYEKVSLNLARSAAAVDLARTACALERYFLAHGIYPESLTQLMPAYLSTVPVDVINGSPLYYKRNNDGTFSLYSVGADGDDNGGKRLTDFSKSDSDGDWVW